MSKKDILNVIVVTAAPHGRFLEGIVSGTPKPGVMMQVKAGVAMDARGRLTWEVFNGTADGEQTLVAILREDDLQGNDCETAYVDGTRCFLYCPIPGDELLVRVSAPGTGTGDAFSIGDKLMVNDGDGTFVATTGTPESEPFIVEEDISDVAAAGTLVLCLYTGH